MNLKPLRIIAALGWVPPGNEPPRLTVSRSGGLLRYRTIQGGGIVLGWAPDDGEDFAARSVTCRAFRVVVGDVNEGDVVATSNGLSVVAPGFVADLRATDGEAPESVPDGGVVLAAEDVARIAWVFRSVASADNRYGLSGLHVDERDGHPIAACTDGNRLNRARIDALAGVWLPAKNLFTADWWRVAAKLAGKGGMRILIVGNQAWAVGDGWAVRARLTEAEFPDYRAVIPMTMGGEIRVDAAILSAALRRVAGLAGTAHAQPVTVKLVGSDLTISTHGSRDLDASTSVTIPAVSTGWVTKGLSCRLLSSAIQGIAGEVVIREGGGDRGRELAPVTIEIADGRRAIVMPVRLD